MLNLKMPSVMIVVIVTALLPNQEILETFSIFIIIYLQTECIEKYQLELCSKYDREYGFDVILG